MNFVNCSGHAGSVYRAGRLVALLLFSFSVSMLMAQADRIFGPIDAARTVNLRGHVPSRAQAKNDRGPADASFLLQYMTLALKPSAGQQAALDRLLERQQQPGSPEYRRWLQPEEFADRFGLSRSDLSRITDWLRASGFQVHDVARGRHWVTFSGTAGQVSRAFRTEIHRYELNGKMHYANSTDPAVPAALKDIVSAIRGLNDFPLRARPAAAPLPRNNLGGSHFLAPDDFATIYNLKPLYDAGIDGTGQTIAIIGQTDVDLADTRAFRQRFNLPPNDPQLVLYGPDPKVPAGGEANLDLQWSGAVAPGATIIYVNSRSVFTSVQYAVDQNLAPVMSMSYGFCEPGDQSAAPSLRTVAQQGNAQGITWMNSSGDNGAADCDEFSERQATFGYAVDFPGSLPEVTSVGGTQFNENGGTYWSTSNNANGGSALGYIPETVWGSAGGVSGGGGGASILFPKPLWQSGAGVPNDGARDVPDISLSGSTHDAYLIYQSGFMTAVGGTSASSPAFAGIVALVNQYLQMNGAPARGLGNINPMLYRLAQTTPAAFHDVADGSNIVPCMQISPGCVNGNLGFLATANYDLASGLGSVDAYQFVTQFSTAAANSTVTTLTSAAPGALSNGSVVLTATVAPSSGSGTPTGSVSFHAGDTRLTSADLDSSTGTATATVTVYGGQLPAGDSTITATYTGDGIYNGSSGSVSFHVDVPSAASAVVVTASPNPVSESLSTSNWLPTIKLTETAGVATTLTDFTINGVSHASEINSDFGTSTIPAGKSISGRVTLAGLKPPTTVTFGFSGVDASGQTWSQQLPVPFYGPSWGYNFGFSHNPVTVRQDPNADPSCQWSQQIATWDITGFPLQVTKLMAGKTDMSSQITQIFGTSRVAPYGALRGILCWPDVTPPSSPTLELDAVVLEGGGGGAIQLFPSLQGPLTSPAALQVSPMQVTMMPDDSGNASATLAIQLGGAPIAWTSARFPGNLATNWLTVTPASGTGDGPLTLQASAAGLSPGVYKAVVLVRAPNALPAILNVTVAFVVGPSDGISISSVGNTASGQTTAAPGMMMTITGTGLATASQTSRQFPLPLSMQGVSATVDGLTAPLFSVGPGQLTIQVPYEVGAGTSVVGINNNGHVASYFFPVAPAAPGIFADSAGNLQGQLNAKHGQNAALTITGDGDINTLLATGSTPSATTTNSRLPHPTLPVSVTVGGVPATMGFVGITSGLVGQTQVNFTIPDEVPAGPQAVVVTVGGAASPPANVNVQ